MADHTWKNIICSWCGHAHGWHDLDGHVHCRYPRLTVDPCTRAYERHNCGCPGAPIPPDCYFFEGGAPA